MTTGVKKKWLVRTFDDFSDELQRILNDLDADGYVIYDIDVQRSRVIAYLKEESPLKELFLKSIKGEPTEKPEPKQPPVAKDEGIPPDAIAIRGERTGYLLVNTIKIVDSRCSKMEAIERAEQVVDHTFHDAPHHQIALSIEDVTSYLKIHTSRASCDDDCAVAYTMEAALNRLKVMLGKNPVN